MDKFCFSFSQELKPWFVVNMNKYVYVPLIMKCSAESGVGKYIETGTDQKEKLMGRSYKMLCRCCPLLLMSEYVTASKATYLKTAEGGGLVFWFTL